MVEKINAYDNRNERVELDEEYEAAENEDVALEEIGNSSGEEEEQRKSRMQMTVPR